MKTSNSANEKSKPKLFQRLSALIRPGKKNPHRLSANVTGEEDWEVDEPQIRMSRAFAIMLVLHLVAIGGLFAFNMFGKDDHEAELSATRAAHQASLPPPNKAVLGATSSAASAVMPPRAEVAKDEPVVPTEQRHLFKIGETKMLIAAKFGVTVRELEEANPNSEFKTGENLSIPSPHRVIGALADSKSPANPPVALIVASVSEEVGHRDFSLKKGVEDPYAPVDPAEIAALTPERPASRTKTVKADPVSASVSAEDASEEPEETAPNLKVKKVIPLPNVPTKPKPAANGSRTHVIGKGDTIYNVARRYGLSPNEIMRANGIVDPSRLQMGQVLKIAVRR